MHQRNRTWMIGSDPVERVRQRTMAIGGGDGSTLNLDFTSGVLDPLLTFTRASNATFINLQGYVEWTKSNLFLRSNELGNASWTALNITRASSTAPDGTNTATEIIETAVNNVHTLIQAVSNIRGLRYTASFYMKAGVNRTIGWIRDNNIGSDALIFYTLTGSGSYSIANGSYGITGSIERLESSDWYRCIFSITCANGSDANIQIGTAPNTIFGSWSFLGVAGNSIHVWGAQAEMGYVARPLMVTTSTAKYDNPRFEYSSTIIGQPRGLMLEGPASNYLPYSNTFTDASWEKGVGAAGDVVITAPTPTTETLAPDGLNTATKITKPVGTGYGFIRKGGVSTGTTAGVRTISIWVKQPASGAARYFGLRATGDGFAPAVGDLHATFDLQTGTVVSNTGTGYYTNVFITSAGNGWYRISATSGSMTGTGVSYASYSIVDPTTGAESNNQTGSLYIWGAQYEFNSVVSSYIPTGSSQVTRLVDITTITGSNFSSWFNSSQGTFLAEFQTLYSGLSKDANLFITFNSLGQYRLMYFQTDFEAMGTYDGTTIISAAGDVTGNISKCASTYTSTSRSIVANGGTVSTGAVVAGYSSAATSLGIAVTNPKILIRKLKFYPTALPNSQLQTITAL